MADNCVPVVGTARTLWRSTITIDSAPALGCRVRLQLQGLAAGLVRYWVLKTLRLAMPLQAFLPKLNVCWSVLPSRLLGNLPCKLL